MYRADALSFSCILGLFLPANNGRRSACLRRDSHTVSQGAMIFCHNDGAKVSSGRPRKIKAIYPLCHSLAPSVQIHPPMTNIVVTALALIGHANGFNLQNIFKPPTIGKASARSSKVDLVDEELQLLRKIRNTGNGKDANIETQASVLTIVRRLETRAGPSPTLLSDAVANDPAAKSLLDGSFNTRHRVK